MQLPLLNTQPPLSPLPVDSSYYVAAVQSQKGERDALREASAETWERMVPLIHIVGRTKRATKPYQATTVSGWLKRIVEAVGDHPVYLDVMRLDPLAPAMTTKGVVPVLDQIFVAARRRKLRFVPVVWVGESKKKHVDIVANARASDGRGVALRYRFLKAALPPGQTRGKLLAEMLTSIGCATVDADLLLDLEYLDPDEDFDAPRIAASIKEMEAVGQWRSIVLLASSMPSAMSCIEKGTLGSLPRREWELWTQLAECGLPRLPTYGDYAVQHPRPPSGGGPGMRGTIRYTANSETLIARTDGPVMIVGNDEYPELCTWLMSRQEFCGPKYTWGDRTIDDCGKGRIAPGSQGMWRGAGTSHHLRFVTDQIRERVGQS
jgi:hypothetical protein